MIASIDSKSRGSGGGRDIAFCSRVRSDKFEYFFRGIVSWNSADPAAAKRARATEENIFPFGLHSPGADLFLPRRKRPGGRVVENISVIHAQRVLDVDRAFAFDAQAAVAS